MLAFLRDFEISKPLCFRVWLSCLLGVLSLLQPPPLRAQTLQEDPARIGAFKCLSRNAEALRGLEKLRAEVSSKTATPARGFVRFKLEFRQADQAPRVEVMAKSAGAEAMAVAMQQYIESYRLPCLGEGVSLQASQEFYFDGLADPEVRPLRVLSLGEKPSEPCLLTPKQEFGAQAYAGYERAVVIVDALFSSGAADAPSLSVRYADPPASFEKAVLAHMAQYRMPCRTSDSKATSIRQVFKFRGTPAAAQFRSPLKLQEFLSMVSNGQSQNVFFDLSSMACPFRVKWSFFQPKLPNEAVQLDPVPNPNRGEFLAWLASLQLSLKPEMASDLFAESLLIDVPCALVDIKPRSAS